MRSLVSVGCLSLLWGSASGGRMVAQPALVPAPEGVQLQVTESALDLATPTDVVLHLQLMNGSPSAVSVWPGMASLVLSGDDGHGGQCDNPPNPAARPDATKKILRPGESYSETLTLNTEVCQGVKQARSVKVQRTIFLAAGDRSGAETTVESAAIPVKSASSADAIRAVLSRQAADWNRGDLDAFATGYKNSPDILFIGRKISRGYDGMLATYKQNYATREAMGTLTFSELEVQPLDERLATVTGHFHLERTQAGGGNADGYFLLVVEDTADGWKIVRDDTTALPFAGAH